MAHKTKAEWEQSSQDLNKFLQVGDTVDKEMWEYFLGVLPPAYCSGSLLQIGEPHDHVQGCATFPTLHMEAGLWTWKGNCYRGKFMQPYPDFKDWQLRWRLQDSVRLIAATANTRQLWQPDYPRLAMYQSRHCERFARFVRARGLVCQECGGAGGWKEPVLDDGTGPSEYCGMCEGTGYVTPWMRGRWLRWKREEKRCKI